MRHSQHLACACRVRDCWRQRRDVQQVEAISQGAAFRCPVPGRANNARRHAWKCHTVKAQGSPSKRIPCLRPEATPALVLAAHLEWQQDRDWSSMS